MLLVISAVRVASWGGGNKLFATASDPFNSREFGLVSIFEFPTPEILAESKLTMLFPIGL